MTELIAFHSRPATPVGSVFQASVPYADRAGGPLVLHLYRPVDLTEIRPMIVFVHGGGWMAGHPFAHVRRAAFFADLGWAAASITYRRASEAPWPAQLHDVLEAIGWLRSNAGTLGVDAQRIVVGGDSSGAQLAVTAGLDAAAGVSGCVLWCPVTDLRTVNGVNDAIELLFAGDGEALTSANPIEQLHAGAPPTLSFAASDDDVVPVASVRAFHDALDELGVRNELVEYRGAGHAFDFAPELWTDSSGRAARFLAECI